MTLAGKTVVITGASRGIGRASAIALAAEGAKIVGVARTKAELDSLVAQITASGGSAIAVVADVTKSADVARSVQDAVTAFGRVDILVNNVGMGGYRPFLEWSEEDYDRIMATNAKSSWLYAREIIPVMRKNGASGGQIINVSSVAGLQAYPNEIIYCMSKAAQQALTQGLDREFFRENIKCAAVCPGGVETHFALGDGRSAGSEAMQGFSTAEDVAEAVVLAAIPRPRSRIVNVIMRPVAEMQ